MKKMISRRNFLKAAALAGSAMALTACGGKGSAGDEAAAAVVVDGPVEFPLAETVTLTGTTSYPAGSDRNLTTAPFSSGWKNPPTSTSSGLPSSPTSGATRSA